MKVVLHFWEKRLKCVILEITDNKFTKASSSFFPVLWRKNEVYMFHVNLSSGERQLLLVRKRLTESVLNYWLRQGMY